MFGMVNDLVSSLNDLILSEDMEPFWCWICEDALLMKDLEK